MSLRPGRLTCTSWKDACAWQAEGVRRELAGAAEEMQRLAAREAALGAQLQALQARAALGDVTASRRG